MTTVVKPRLGNRFGTCCPCRRSETVCGCEVIVLFGEFGSHVRLGLGHTLICEVAPGWVLGMVLGYSTRDVPGPWMVWIRAFR